ncbi:CoA transferase [Polaromonas sp. P1-6]|nr:CoA transferase [Polaromonas sp. P1-6]
MRALPLAGIRVADFTWIGAGSFTTKLLADFGADVIKIESSERLDSLRISRPFRDGREGLNRSGYFADRNTSKRSITLNMKHASGQALARTLIAKSDVVANNFTPGTMEKFGLGYESVRLFKPDIVYLAMSMQGASGPEHKYLGYGLTIGALTGLQYLSGDPDREPAGTGTNYSDHIPNPCHAAFATIAALHWRSKSGKGQLIDVAQTEPTVALLGPSMLDFTANGRKAERTGNDRPHAFPHGVLPCAGDDSYIAVSVSTPAHWTALVAVLGGPTWMTGTPFQDINARREQRDLIESTLATLSRQFDGEQLMSQLQARGVPAGVVRTAKDIVDHDPQLRHREHWVKLDHPEMGLSVYNAPPFRISGVDQTPLSPAPLLGEHTDEVLKDLLDVSEDRLAELRSDGALR